LDKYLGNFLITLNLWAARTLGYILKRNHSLEPAPKNILFIKIMGIGSVLMAADSILAIKNKYPNANLILLANRSVISGIQPTQLFDEYWEFKDKNFFQAFCSTITNLCLSWRRKNKWVFNLEVYSRLTTIFSLWTMARNRFDFFFNEVSFRKNINTHPVYFNQFGLAHENYDRMAEAAGAISTKRFELPGFPISHRTGVDKPCIIINNTCSELARERLYPTDLLVQLCKELFRLYSLPIVLTGTKSDAEYYEGIIANEELKELPISHMAGKQTIDQLLQLLYRDCRLLITVDSAPLHYAYRLGVPTVSLWGPTHPATRIRETFSFKAVYLAVHCSPCTHHTSLLPCGGNNFCMKNMGVHSIIFTVKDVMENSP
jgi:ADP-heptose:LPS heptosyltransferase